MCQVDTHILKGNFRVITVITVIPLVKKATNVKIVDFPIRREMAEQSTPHWVASLLTLNAKDMSINNVEIG